MEEERGNQGNQDLQGIERIDISSNLVASYLINMGKAFIFIGLLVGAFYAVQHVLGANPFVEMFDDLGIPVIWATRAAIIFFGAFLVLAFLTTLSLSSYRFVFEGDTMTYSYGGFFKVTRATPISNIVRVNFRKIHLASLGDIELELSGTEEKALKVQYVSDASRKCDLINRLINLKKSDVLQDIDKEVGL